MARDWGNGDPSFNKMFVKMFGSDSAENRRRIFKQVCIPFRLALYLSLFYLSRYTAVIIIIIIASGFAIFSLIPSIKDPGEQWWSRRWHLATSCFIFASACIGLYMKLYKNNAQISTYILQYAVPGFFMIDLIPGLYKALFY